MTPKIITNWSITSGNAPFPAPEQRGIYLSGICDEKTITTSRVVEIVAPRTYRTRSGSLYRLDGEPNEVYVKWCQAHAIVLNKENPIVLIKPQEKS